MEINFHIPDFVNHLHLNGILINMVSNHPEYFHDGLKIASVFGCFGGCVWNGGRFLGGRMDMRFISGISEAMNIKGIPLRFTFTNPLIEQKHLGDSYGNQILRTCNNGLNEVIVMSPLLEEYVRKNYPEYKLTSSTCKQIESIDGVIEELGKDYKYVVLDYNFNNRFDLLEKIDPKDRPRCELLVNACCTPHCKRRGEHYRHIGREQIREWEYCSDRLNKKPFVTDQFECEFMSRTIYDITGSETHISPQDILEKYLPMGYNCFKIEGRTLPDVNMLETYVYYMVKPEFQDKVRLDMLLKLTKKHKYFV